MTRKKKREARIRREGIRTQAIEIARSCAMLLDEAERHLDEERWDEARRCYEDLFERRPSDPEVLFGLSYARYKTGDLAGAVTACRDLAKLQPRDPEVAIMLAGLYLEDVRPVSAREEFRRFLRLAPDDPRVDEVRETLDDIGRALTRMASESGIPLGDLDALRLHEEMVSATDADDFQRVLDLGEDLLARLPRFVPALNNVGEAHFRLGRTDEAIAHARRTLEIDADNCHALANLARYLLLSDRGEEAAECGARLKAAPAPGPDTWAKKAEGLSYLGDDQGVLDVFNQAESDASKMPPPCRALLCHLAAVAAMRQGDEPRARKLWREAMRIDPDLTPAAENLDDLRQPVGERHAPWAFGLGDWLPAKFFEDLRSEFPDPDVAVSEAESERLGRFLARRPGLAPIIPLLFDRGDPAGRNLAMTAARLTGTPEFLAALRDFAFGSRGPDAMRWEAAMAARKAGLLPTKVPMWVEGARKEIGLFGFEITREPTSTPHPAQVQALAAEAIEALHAGDFARAETILGEALKLAPDAKDLLNNLAAAYRGQGREEEAERLVREIHRRHPDYLFARVSLANMFIRGGQLDRAQEMLAPLLEREVLHATEFTVLCDSQIALCVARDLLDGARHWLSMWKEACPEQEAAQSRWESRLARLSLAGGLRRMFRGLMPRRRR